MLWRSWPLMCLFYDYYRFNKNYFCGENQKSLNCIFATTFLTLYKLSEQIFDAFEDLFCVVDELSNTVFQSFFADRYIYRKGL